MPLPSGWRRNAAGAVSTGTTSVTPSVPAGVVNGDDLWLCVVHKGAGWAVVPAGWTLVDREISGSTRLEVHYRRANAEPANYSITGLADTAAGVIVGYRGGASSSIVSIVRKQACPSGTDANVPSFDVPDDRTLVLTFIGIGAAATPVSVGARSATDVPSDLDLNSMRSVVTGTTTLGSDCALGIFEGFKTAAGFTGTIQSSHANAESVMIVAAFKQDEGAGTAGSRFYWGLQVPSQRILEPLKGTWQDGIFSLNVSGLRDRTYYWRLTPRVSEAGTLSPISTFVTNQQGNYDVILGVFMTRPLAAGAIGGTIDLCHLVLAAWNDFDLGLTDQTVARYKLHVYISVGETGQVRHTLLNNYVDANDFPKWGPSIGAWQSLAAPQNLAPGNIQTGDCIVIELGVRVVSSPAPPPTYPPTERSEITLIGFGGTGTSALDGGLGTTIGQRADATNGSTNFSLLSWVEFSDTLTELAPGAGPVNITPATAREITTLPYTDAPYDTTNASSPNRSTWYRWTATTGRRVLFHTLGSTYRTRLEFFTGTVGSLTRVDPAGLFTHDDPMAPQRSQTAVWLMAPDIGTTYFIRVSSIGGAVSAQSSGGVLRFGAAIYFAPQADDLFLPNDFLTVFRDGVIVNLKPDILSERPNFVGIDIDYSRSPMSDLNDFPAALTNTKPRVIVAGHDSDVFYIYDAADLNVGRNPVDWIQNPIYANEATNFAPSHVLCVGNDKVYLGWFGDGYLHLIRSGTESFIGALDRISDPAVALELRAGNVRSLSRTSADNQPSAPFNAADTHPATPEVTAPHHFAIDGHVMYYTSGAWHIDVGGQTVKRWNLGTNQPMADFSTVPPSGTKAPAVRGLCLVPGTLGGGLLVCNGNQVVRLNSSGVVVRAYTPEPAIQFQSLCDVRMCAAGDKFWVVDNPSVAMAQFDLETGEQLQYHETYLRPGRVSQFALYQPDGVIPIDQPPATTVKRVRRLRRSTYLSNENMRVFFHRFALDMQVGVGLESGQGSDPQIMMRYSDDGGRTWSRERWVSVGAIGEYSVLVEWFRNGTGRRRIWEISMSDPVKWAIFDAFVDAEPGNS